MRLLIVIAEVLLPLASAWLLACSANDERFADLAWLALMPLAYVLSRHRVRILGWCAVWAGGAWFHYHGITWLRETQSPVIQPTSWWWVIQAGILGASWLFAALVTRDFQHKLRLPLWFSFAAGWTAGEFVRMHMSAVADETGYPWLQLAGFQTHHPTLLQSADLGGAWLIGAIVAGANAVWIESASLAVRALSSGRRRIIGFANLLGAGVFALSVFLYGHWRLSQPPPTPGPTVCLMPAGEISNDRQPLFARVTAACGRSGRPDWLLWPEFTLGNIYEKTPGFDAGPRLELLANYSRANDVALIVGSNRRVYVGENSREYNAVLLADPRQGHIGWYDKMALIPWKEFPPWIAWPGMNVVEVGFEHGREATVHEIWSPSRERTFRVAATVCYDTCFAWVHRSFFRNRADVDVFLACSAEWLDSHRRGSRQILALARLRAVECRRAIARCVHNGYSAVIDGNGALCFRTEGVDIESPTPVGAIPIDRRWSLYRQFGDWLPASILCIWILIQLPLRRLTSRRTGVL